MIIAIYSRKSKLTGKGESIQNQIELCKEYANKHFAPKDFIIYEDEGFSGGNSDRPEYKKMLRDANKGKFQVLMCYRLDRISRSISDFSDTLETLQENNISFISIREQFDTSTPMGRAMLYIAGVFAQLERETIAERIKDNMLQLSRSGRWLGGKTPTGYTSEPIEYYDNDMNKKTMFRLKGVPKELRLVKKIFNKYLEFGSLNQVEAWATENNIKTPNGKVYNLTATKGILTNMVYARADEKMYEYCSSLKMDIASNKSEFDGNHGLMVYNKTLERKGKANKKKDTSEWIVAVGEHEGIIDSKDFIKVQKMLKKNRNKAPRAGTSKVGLLNTLIKCKYCGSKFRITYGTKKKDGSRAHYYKCILKEKSKGTKCNTTNIIGIKAEEIIIKEIAKLFTSIDRFLIPRYAYKYCAMALNSISSNDGYASLSKELQEYEKKIKVLILQLSENEDSPASKYIIEEIEKIDNEIKCVKNKIKLLEKEESVISNDNKITSIKELIFNFSDNINSLSHEEKKKLVSKLLDEIIWNGEKLEIKFYGSN